MLRTLLNFFLSNQIKNRKTLVITILGIVPIGISLLLAVLLPIFNRGDTESLDSIFSNFTFILYLHFLVPIVALFLGTGVIADEVEDGTLPYLLVRPVPRYLIVLAKYLACLIIGGVIIISSLFVSYGIMKIGSFSSPIFPDIGFILQSSAILLLGLSVYSVLFSLFGGVFRHPMVIGLLFVFGWEKIIAYIPGNVRLLTVMNYLQTLYPTSEQIHLPWISSQMSNVTAIIVLFLLLLTFGGLSFNLPSLKEYH